MSPPVISHSKPWLTAVDRAAVKRQMLSGAIAAGEAVNIFEERLARYLGVAGCVVTSSGTAALILCLRCLGIGADNSDEVLLPTYVCRSLIAAVQAVGGRPILCDASSHWTTDDEGISAKFGPNTKAAVAVHTFGIAAQMDLSVALSCPIIEDFCQAFGAIRAGHPVALVGHAGFFSFQATKCLTSGVGGAVASNDPDFLERARRWRDECYVVGTISDLQAALGLSQLARYPEMLERRRAIASRYFSEFPHHLTAPLRALRHKSIFYRFPIRIDGKFEAVQARFLDRGVEIRRGVDALLHRSQGLSDNDFPKAVSLFRTTASVPIYPAMTSDDVTRVIDAVKEVCKLGTDFHHHGDAR